MGIGNALEARGSGGGGITVRTGDDPATVWGVLALVGILAAALLIAVISVITAQLENDTSAFHRVIADLDPRPPVEPKAYPSVVLPPEPIGENVGWFTQDDYPASALRRGAQGNVRVGIRIDPRGHVRRCDVLVSSHEADLDKVTCNVVLERARFEPARGANNRRIWSIYVRNVRWVVPKE